MLSQHIHGQYLPRLELKINWKWLIKLIKFQVNYVQYEGEDLEESAWCSMPFDPEDMDKTPLYFTVASTILYFLVPFTIVFVLYTR